ncbi:MAG: PEP-CTERM sorting domain-containing protein [Phycisphaerales bacterium]|nr:PEP-CTERM sorting domain-containing protein [Phycisphaerales bacterium]|tara:strand:- start:4675 stop:5193 length:519 start_codon:yes stop_codon:yes gene_type:complete
MKYQIHTLFLIAFAVILPTDSALAMNEKKGNPDQIAWQPQKPIKFYPLAHTNQDDDSEKRMMFGEAPDNLSLDSGIRLPVIDLDESLLELMIRISMPVGIQGPIQSDDMVTPSLQSFSFGTFFISSSLDAVENSKSVTNRIAKSQPPVVPAPGVLGLLAIAGLTASSRRRRR